jgi:hypothetical protein
MTSPSDAARPDTVVFTEGRIGLPVGYEDRSTNLLVPADTQRQPNLSVARDWLQRDETLDGYVERQVALLKAQLPSHKLLARQGARLGAGDAALLGQRIDATYKNGKLTIHQRQAAFEVSPRRVLVLSAATAQGFGSAFDQLWSEWLGSYEPPTASDPPAA